MAVPAQTPKPVSLMPNPPRDREDEDRQDVEEEDGGDGVGHLLVVRVDDRAVAAMAEPPQMEVPTPMRMEVCRPPSAPGPPGRRSAGTRRWCTASPPGTARRS